MTEISPALIAELDKIREPGALLAELHRRFGGRMAVATSGQLTDTAIIALAVKAGARPRVYTADTLRLFPETYAHFKEVEDKYGVRIERLVPDRSELEKMVREQGEFLFFDSKEKQEFCCAIRKVHSNDRMLDQLDCWVTGLRAAQSAGRAGMPRLEIFQHKGRPILKAQPLVDWSEEKLRAYMKENGVPMHALMKDPLPGGWYYESLGCVICTTPIGPHEPRRSGRWRWFNQDANKECGLHLPRKAGGLKELSSFLPVAAGLALEAGRRVMALLQDPLVRETKPDQSLVTNADHAANDILRAGLRRAFPDHALISEETGMEGPSDAKFLWLVDPLDGTRAYAKGKPGFSVMLGLLWEGRPVLGVVYDPTEDRLYEAARGGGAFHTRGGDRTPLRVSDREVQAALTVVTSTGFPEPLRKALAPSFTGPWLPPINSVGIKAGLVARGEADVYIGHHPVHVWDTAGPQAVLEEAGGRMTHWDGTPLRYDLGRLELPKPTLVTNGRAHAAAVAALRVLT